MLDEELLLENVAGSSRKEIYRNMLSTLAEYAELTLDIPALVEEMLQHEADSGVLFPRMDMPHLRLNDLHDLFIVVGLPADPQAADADMVFMSLIGENMSDVYLKMISALARQLTRQESAEALISAARGGKAVLWNYLQESNIKLRNVVTAEDVMSQVQVALHCSDPLSKAFDMFNRTHARFLPVVDDHGRLSGELSARKVVKSFIPDYVFMMDNVNFVNDFSVFNKIFESEHTLPVSGYMDKSPAQAALDTPLFQLTLLLTKQDGGGVYIVDAENMLCGVFTIENVISKVLRG